MALARRGEDVLVVERDAGPAADGTWNRTGVMQFDHPHYFRAGTRLGLLAELPDVYDALVAARAEPQLVPGRPVELTGFACRRRVFETVLRGALLNEPGVAVRQGSAERIVLDDGAVTGVVVDGELVETEQAVVATGRASNLGSELRPPAEGGPTGFSYVSRMYAAKDGVATPTFLVPSVHRGYQTIVFPQDAGTISVLIVRATADKRLALLREREAYDAAVRAIPNVAPWTDPERFVRITDVLPGGGLWNSYQRQAPVRGLFFVGDAVCTTNPAAGRGVSLGIQHALQLLSLLDDPTVDDPGEALDGWSGQNLRPWFADHVHWDATLLRRMAGEDIDLDAPLPSDVICACAEQDPSILAAAGPFMGMVTGPGILGSVADRAVAVLRTGWRPPWSEGPTAEELADLIGV